MTYTSAQAAKLLSKLQQDYEVLATEEENSKTFLASVGEDVESVRPEYRFEATQTALDEIEAQIRKVKHAVNLFNTTTTVPGFNMTVDEMLVYLPQLTKKKEKLKKMANTPVKARHQDRYEKTTYIDYEYANYDLATVRAELDAVTDKLSQAQLALDEVNHASVFEIDI